LYGKFYHLDYVNTLEQARISERSYFLKGSLNIYLEKEATHVEGTTGPLNCLHTDLAKRANSPNEEI